MNEHISFKCHGCGDCCNNPPVLTVQECFDLSREFIIGLNWKAVPPVSSGLKSNGMVISSEQADAINKCYDDSYAAINGLPTGKAYLTIFPSVMDYSLDDDSGRCSMLSADNTCSIYERRPNICKSVPFHPSMPEFIQGEVLKQFNFSCVSVGGDNEVFDGQHITNSVIAQNFNAHQSEMMKDGAILASISNVIDLGMGPSKDDIVETLNGGTWIETDLMPLIMALSMFGHEYESSYQLLNDQICLIEQSISEAVSRKNKNQRKEPGYCGKIYSTIIIFCQN